MEDFTEDEKRLIAIAQDQYMSEDEIAELSIPRLIALLSKIARQLDAKEIAEMNLRQLASRKERGVIGNDR